MKQAEAQEDGWGLNLRSGKAGIFHFLMPSFIKLIVTFKLNYANGDMIVPC